MKTISLFLLSTLLFASVSRGGDENFCDKKLKDLNNPPQVSQEKSSKERIGGVFETITSTLTGAQVYAVVSGEHPEGYKPGFYKRSLGGWDLLIPGNVMTDERGAPQVIQLDLSKADNKDYALAVVDGAIYLVSSQSSAHNLESFMHLGAKEHPLYEISSMQKRFLEVLKSSSQISIYQDDVLSHKGSQLVLISVKFFAPQTVGEGLTFAFEILPNVDKSKITLNGRPIVIDYDFRSTKELSELVGTDGDEAKLIFSKILVDHFENTPLTSFGSHIDYVKNLVTDYASEIMAKVNWGSYIQSAPQKVAFDITNYKIYKDVSFEKEFILDNSSAKFSQEYFPAISKSRLTVSYDNSTFNFDGSIDLFPNGSPAVWEDEGSGIIFSVNNSLHVITSKDNKAFTTDLGSLSDIFKVIHGDQSLPEKMSTYFYLSAKEGPEGNGLIIFSAKMKNGAQGTAAIKLRLLGQQYLQMNGEPFLLLDYFISPEEIKKRTHVDSSGEVIFDTMTPQVGSLAAYDQENEPSAPYLNIFESSKGGKKYKFKEPSKLIKFNDKLNYAFFAATDGIEDPSGIYFNIPGSQITGNESTRTVGQLLPNPNHLVDEGQALASEDYIFAKEEFSIQNENTDVSGVPEDQIQRLFLFATDATKEDGLSGFQFTLLVSHHETDGDFNSHEVYKPSVISAIPPRWLGSIKNYNSAAFIRGGKSYKNKGFLLLSFKIQGGEEATFSFTIDLEKPGGVLTPVLVDHSLITASDLEARLGFDEKGAPAINLTPELSTDSHLFSVFDFLLQKKISPNQGDARGRPFTFGDYKRSASSQDVRISSNDAWHITYLDLLRKKYPDLGKSAELAQFDSFIELAKQLDSMADSKGTPKRLILVVPPTLREMVWDFVLKKGISGQRNGSQKNVEPFSFSNSDLLLNIFDPEKASQEQFFANLQFWEKYRKINPEVRNFLILRMDELEGTKKGFPEPKEKDNGFFIRDVGAGTGGDITQLAPKESIRYPHGLYLLAAEKPMPLREFKSEKHPASASMIIIATPEEMSALKSQATSEIENGLLDQFEIKEIKDPDQESMAASLSGIFNNPDVKNLEYTFSAKEIKPRRNLSDIESFDTVIDYAISRFSYLIEQKKESKFESFMRFRSAFATAVLSDKEARKTRVINKFFVERVLTQVFDIPMNLATLPDDDPLKILSRQDSLLLLQEAGYSGPFDLKAKVRDTLLSQARADARKPVPSSIILFGNTGSGKTFMFKSLVKMLHLKLYDFNNPASNADASAIMINMAQVTDGDGDAKQGSLSIDQVITHLETFLAQPGGYRGYILIDDVHSAKDSVKAKMLSWMRGLFESPDGMYTVKFNNKFIRRPVRNLNFFVTLNPTADQEQIAKYAKDKAHPTTEEVLLATLSTSEFKVEPSFLRRFGRIINLDYMPAGAKGPELIKSVAKSSNDLLNTHNRIALVDPKLIQMLVSSNEKVDARSFLSASTSSLIEKAANDTKAGSLVLVVPTVSSYTRGDLGGDIETSPSEKISRWVSQYTRTLSLDSGLDGNLAFIEMIADAFRIPIFESLVMALQEDRRLAGDPVNQKTLLGPILAAIQDHLQERGDITVKDLNLNASDFGLKTASERDYFRSVLDKISDSERTPLFPPFFRSINAQVSTWRDVKGLASQEQANFQKIILSETIQQNLRILHQRLSQTLRVNDVDMLPSPEEWLNHLPSGTGSDPRDVGRGLVEVLWNYLPQIFDKKSQDDLLDRPSLSVYGATRLYLYAIDRAIVQLPWVSTSKFLLKSLEAITEDQVLSQKPGVQSFLFTDEQRLIKPSIPDFTFQIIASSQAIEEINPQNRERMRDEFKARYEESEEAPR